MDQVIALPIRGEAFLLRSGQFRVLVDGGYDSRQLAAGLNKHLPGEDLDIVVCTHADSDHSGGLKDLLKHWQVYDSDSGKNRCGRIGQFWLPGRWVDVLPEVLEAPGLVIDRLLQELDAIASSQTEQLQSEDEKTINGYLNHIVTMEHLERVLVLPDHDVSENGQLDTSDFWGEGITDNDVDMDAIELLDEPEWMAHLRNGAKVWRLKRHNAIKAFASGQRRVRYRHSKGKISQGLAKYWLELITAAKNIRAIAEHAIEHKIPIRWFDFDEFTKTGQVQGGIRGVLMPLNSVEQSRPPLISVSYMAMLSPQNEASLVFMAPPRSCDFRFGVVFCGDSPLGYSKKYARSFFLDQPSPKLPVFATAPHHGSESNAMAYDHLSNWTSVLGWLRTGGDRRHPGQTFKKFDFPRRVCSQCPQNSLECRAAGFTLKMWIRVFAPHVCCC